MNNFEAGSNFEDSDRENEIDNKDDIVFINENITNAGEREFSNMLKDNGLYVGREEETAKEVTARNGYKGTIHSGNTIQRIIEDRNRLLCLKDVDLISDQEMAVLNKLDSDIENGFRITIDEIARTTDREPEEIRNEINSIIAGDMAETLDEAKELIVSEMIVKGFEGAEDIPQMSAEFIKEFLDNTFTIDFLRKNGVSRIIKKQDYYYIDGPLVGIAEDRNEYLKEEMRLEGVDDIDKLKHRYKIRAKVGGDDSTGTIFLGNFEFDDPSLLDHIKDLEIESKEKQMILYVLGTIAHEVAHKYENINGLEEYQELVGEDGGVSEYVNDHRGLYGSSKKKIIKEDFAEAVRIYATNPKYLEENYPSKFSYINNLSIAKPGGAFLQVFPERL